MDRKPLFKDSLGGVFLIDILATGVGIIVLLLVLSVSKNIVITKELRKQNAIKATKRLEEYATGGKFPIHADATTHDYETCYREARELNAKFVRSRPIIKLYEYYAEIEETGQTVSPKDLISNDKEINPINNYLKSILSYMKKRGLETNPRIQLHVFSAELYYPLLAKMQQFGLRPNDFHFFPAVELPNEFDTKYQVVIKTDSVDYKHPEPRSPIQKTRRRSLKEKIGLESFSKVDSLKLELLKKAYARMGVSKIDSLIIPDDLIASLADEKIQQEPFPASTGSISRSPIEPVNSIELDSIYLTDPIGNVHSGKSLGKLLIPDKSTPNEDSMAVVIIEVIIPESTFVVNPPPIRGERAGGIISGLQPTINGFPSYPSDQKKLDSLSNLNSIIDQLDLNELDSLVYFGTGQPIPYELFNEENSDYFKQLQEALKFIREREGDENLDLNKMLFNLLSNTLQESGLPVNIIYELPLLSYSQNNDAGRPYIKLPLDTSITNFELGYKSNSLLEDTTALCLFMNLRNEPFPSGGEPCFIFKNDKIISLFEDSTATESNKFDWILIGRVNGEESINPQTKNSLLPGVVVGYAYGLVESNYVLLDVEKNGLEILPRGPDFKRNERPLNIWSPTVLMFEILAVVMVVFLLHYRGKKHFKNGHE